jgi:integrase
MLMDGCGVRLSEAANLRIHQCNVDTGMLSIQFGKGGTSRSVPLPKKIHGAIMRPFETVRALHHEDLQQGDDGVFLPASFEQKAQSAARDLVWPWCFPAQRLTLVEATRDMRRDHGHETAMQRAIKAAARKAGIPKRVSPHTLRHNPEYRIMPSRFENAVNLSRGSSWYSTLLEAFQEGQQFVIRSVAARLAVYRRSLREGLLLELETGVQIHLGGVHRLVPKPQRDDRTVDATVQQRHRGAVAQDMRRDPFAL